MPNRSNVFRSVEKGVSEGGLGAREGTATVSLNLQALPSLPPGPRQQQPPAGECPRPQHWGGTVCAQNQATEARTQGATMDTSPSEQSGVQPPPIPRLGYKPRPDLVLPLPGELGPQAPRSPGRGLVPLAL